MKDAPIIVYGKDFAPFYGNMLCDTSFFCNP